MRRMVTVLILATTLATLIATQQVSAAAWRLYHNATFGFSVSYPGDWVPFKAPGTNLAIRTADTNAVFDASAQGNIPTPTAAELHQAVTSILGSAGIARSTKVQYSTTLIHGVKFTRGVAKLTRLTGQAITFTGLVAYRAHTIYVFATALVIAVNGTPRAPAPAQGRALARVLASITITGPAGP
jgi:hypothetical protein